MIFATLTAGKDAFLLHCNNERGLSKNTIDAYGQDIDVFILLLKSCNRQTVFNGAMILNYLDYLKTERKQKHATVHRRLVTLRAYAAWLRKAGELGCDPFADLEIDLRPPKRLPRPIEWVDVRTMLQVGQKQPHAPAGTSPAPHNRAYSIAWTTSLAIKLMVATGVRVGELTRIKLSNISNDGYRIRIHGKGNKERNVYISSTSLREQLQLTKQQAARYVPSQNPVPGRVTALLEPTPLLLKAA